MSLSPSLARPRRPSGRVPAFMALVAALAAPLAAGAPAASPEDGPRLLKQVEARYARVQGLSATFTQSYRSAALGQQVVERGRLFIKRPGRMRWDYRTPDRKVFVVSPDGSTLTYVPADLSAVKGRLPESAPHLELLLGESDLHATFDVELVELKSPRSPDATHLKLTPREPVEGVELLYLEVSPVTRSVERVLVVDALGNESDLVLEKVREDVVLRDADFEIRLPPGTEIRGADPGGDR